MKHRNAITIHARNEFGFMVFMMIVDMKVKMVYR